MGPRPVLNSFGEVLNDYTQEQLFIAICLYVHPCNAWVNQLLCQHADCRRVNNCGTSLDPSSSLYTGRGFAFVPLFVCLHGDHFRCALYSFDTVMSLE